MSTPLPSDDFANEVLAQYENFVHWLLDRANKNEWTRLALGGKAYSMLEGDIRDIKAARERGERYRTLAAARRYHEDLEVLMQVAVHYVDRYRAELDPVIAQIEEISEYEDYYARLTKGTLMLLYQVNACAPSIKWQSLVIPSRKTAAQQALLAMKLCLKEGLIPGNNIWHSQMAAAWRAYETFAYLDCHRLMKIDGPSFVHQAQVVLKSIENIKAELEAERIAEEEHAREEEVARHVANNHGGPWGNSNSGGYSNNDYDYGPSINPANGMPMMGNSGVDIHGNMYGTNWND